MEGQLLWTLALMFGGALVCGVAPFFLRVRELHLKLVEALGAGLLIGSALAVIVPEGFHAFAQATAHHHKHEEVHAHEHSEHGHSEHEHEHGGVPEGVAGLVLVGGFLAMLLLDHLQHMAGGRCSAPGHAHHHGHAHSHGGEAAAGKGKGKQAAAAGGAGGAAPDPQNAITGLVIHCCADGLAMGAAFLSGNARLSMVVAAAMVMHKAPMAFGFATYLMACRWSFQRARGALLLFASAAPAAALATYGLLGSLTALSSPPAVALCVIFSGGTFLYAATMHILPEVLGGSGHMSGGQLAALTAGSLLPAALSWGHHH